MEYPSYYPPIPKDEFSYRYQGPPNYPKKVYTEEELSAERRDLTQKLCQSAVKCYNEKHRAEYELVDALKRNYFYHFDGIWYHANFTAKDKSVLGEGSPTKLIFAEIKNEFKGKLELTSWRILDGCRKQVDACGRCSGLLHPTFGFEMGLHDDESESVEKPQLIMSTMRKVELMMPITSEMSGSRFQGFGDVGVREPVVRDRGIVGEKSTIIAISGLEERLAVVELQWDEERLARMALESRLERLERLF